MRALERRCLVSLLILLILLMAGCSHSPEKKGEITSAPSTEKRYPGKDHDWGPSEEIDTSNVPDATPRYELRTQAGNKNPYTVLGKTYYLMDDERAYKQRGKASWYGYKFNGERTSNGELYDMFAMTGAHKTLPIPSYVRVTNLANRKSVIVRINDRGPFHEDRIIDLSYAAAQRLDIHKIGTGEVEVEIVVPEDDPRAPLVVPKKVAPAVAKAASNPDVVNRKDNAIAGTHQGIPAGTFLQIGAFSSEKAAKQFAASVGAKLSFPVMIAAAKNPQKVFRVRVGPFTDTQSVQRAREELQKIAILQTHIVYE